LNLRYAGFPSPPPSTGTGLERRERFAEFGLGSVWIINSGHDRGRDNPMSELAKEAGTTMIRTLNGAAGLLAVMAANTALARWVISRCSPFRRLEPRPFLLDSPGADQRN
jgi:hypothetical protein